MYRHLGDARRLLAEHVFPEAADRPAGLAASA